MKVEISKNKNYSENGLFELKIELPGISITYNDVTEEDLKNLESTIHETLENKNITTKYVWNPRSMKYDRIEV